MTAISVTNPSNPVSRILHWLGRSGHAKHPAARANPQTLLLMLGYDTYDKNALAAFIAVLECIVDCEKLLDTLSPGKRRHVEVAVTRTKELVLHCIGASQAYGREHVRDYVDDRILQALEFFEDDVTQSHLVGEDSGTVLLELKEKVQELLAFVASANNLPEQLRLAALEHLRELEVACDRYWVLGPCGVKRPILALTGATALAAIKRENLSDAERSDATRFGGKLYSLIETSERLSSLAVNFISLSQQLNKFLPPL